METSMVELSGLLGEICEGYFEKGECEGYCGSRDGIPEFRD